MLQWTRWSWVSPAVVHLLSKALGSAFICVTLASNLYFHPLIRLQTGANMSSTLVWGVTYWDRYGVPYEVCLVNEYRNEMSRFTQSELCNELSVVKWKGYDVRMSENGRFHNLTVIRLICISEQTTAWIYWSYFNAADTSSRLYSFTLAVFIPPVLCPTKTSLKDFLSFFPDSLFWAVVPV